MAAGRHQRRHIAGQRQSLQQSQAAHLGHAGGESPAEPNQALTQVASGGRHVFQEPRPQQSRQHDLPQPGRHRGTAGGVAMVTRLETGRHRIPHEDRTERNAAANRLGQGHKVGFHAEALIPP